jgi:hypothetical protein
MRSKNLCTAFKERKKKKGGIQLSSISTRRGHSHIFDVGGCPIPTLPTPLYGHLFRSLYVTVKVGSLFVLLLSFEDIPEREPSLLSFADSYLARVAHT